MPQLRFLDDFDFAPAAHNGRVVIAYKAGMRLAVTRECATAALEAGKAERVVPDRADNGA